MIVKHAVEISGEMHPDCDKPYVPIVVSEKVNLIIGQLSLALVVNMLKSITALAVPSDPSKDLSNVKSPLKLIF